MGFKSDAWIRRMAQNMPAVMKDDLLTFYGNIPRLLPVL
jgi:hypothetical protein